MRKSENKKTRNGDKIIRKIRRQNAQMKKFKTRSWDQEKIKRKSKI